MISLARTYGLFRLNTGKYGPEKTPYFDTFHAVGVKNNDPFSNNSPFSNNF